jgi:hypothetical protein
MDTWLIAVLAVAALLVIALLVLAGKSAKAANGSSVGKRNKSALRLRSTGLARKCPRS